MIAMSVASSASSLAGSIAGRAGHGFEVHTMLRGFACHARGVEILETGPAHVRARVRSKRTYEVDLRAEGGRLLIGCTCPARSMEVAACKHAWAALLEVDRQGGLEDLRGVRGVLPVAPAPDRAEERAERAGSKQSTKAARARTSKTDAKPGPARAKARQKGRGRA
jgi:uncharacterized Zn finger protein